MCNFCFDKDYTRFENHQSFHQFEALLDQKRSENGTVIIDHTNSYLGFSYQRITCTNCGTIWWFSFPDNALRGFFMEETSAKDQLLNIRNTEKKKRVGCLWFLAIIASSIAFYLLTD